MRATAIRTVGHDSRRAHSGSSSAAHATGLGPARLDARGHGDRIAASAADHRPVDVRRSAGRRRAVPVPSPRCSNGPRCPRGRASSAPGCPGRVRSPSPRTSWPDRASRPRPRPASPISWSTSRSRARPRIPSTRAISEAIEGVGGSFNAATDRESTVYWVRVPRARGGPGDGRPRRADRPPDRSARREIESERTIIIEEIRSLPRRPVRVLPDPVPERDVRRRSARSRDLRRRGRHPRPARRRRSATSGGPRTGRPTRSWSRGRRPVPRATPSTLSATAFGTGNGDAPGFAPAPGAAGRPTRARSASAHTAQAQLVVGVPALHRDHPDSWTLARAQRRARRRDEQPAVPVRARGARPRLRRLVGPRRLRRCRRARGLGRRRSRPACRAALEAILAELARLRDEPVPDDELEKAKRYLAGGLELRMDDTRHVASWIGGQEALHDRVLTVDEALAAIDAVTRRRRPASSPTSSFRDDGLRLAAVAPARYLRGLERRLRLPA